MVLFAVSCGRWDLNPHERIAHKILSLARLPVPTLPHLLRVFSRAQEVLYHMIPKRQLFFLFYYFFYYPGLETVRKQVQNYQQRIPVDIVYKPRPARCCYLQ